MGYYNWNDTLARDALVTMVIGYRGAGKTYGLRKQFIKDFLKDGSRFCDISRTKSERKRVAQGYFSKLVANGDADNLVFKYSGDKCYVADKPEDDNKPEWEIIGYFVALTEAITAKKQTYVNVKRILFDEALIDKSISPYSRYLSNEFGILANLIDSITRENINNDIKNMPHLYLLGNAVDLTNPYFIGYGINKIPKHGYTWYDRKKFLLHYPEAEEALIKERIDNTLSGYLSSKTEQGASALYNDFSVKSNGLIEKRPKGTKFLYGYTFKDRTYGIWQSRDYYIYVCDKVPKSGALIYGLSSSDDSINLTIARRNEGVFLFLKDCFYNGLVRYNSEGTRQNFIDMLKLFGVS